MAMYNPDGLKLYDRSTDGQYARIEGAYCSKVK